MASKPDEEMCTHKRKTIKNIIRGRKLLHTRAKLIFSYFIAITNKCVYNRTALRV